LVIAADQRPETKDFGTPLGAAPAWASAPLRSLIPFRRGRDDILGAHVDASGAVHLVGVRDESGQDSQRKPDSDSDDDLQ